MENREIFLSDLFKSDKFKEKWLLQLISTVIFSIVIMTITATFSEENTNWVYVVIFSVFSVLWMILIYYIVIFIISKIMKSKSKSASFIKASITITFVTFFVKVIVAIIQLIFSIDLNEHDLLSLNILNINNPILNAIDLYIFLSSYLLILGLYYSSHLKGKTAIIFGCIFLFVNLFFNIVFTLINNAIM